MNSSMDTSRKVQENRLRRAAARRGLAVSKSRRYDKGAIDFDKYAVIDLSSGEVLSPTRLGFSHLLSLDEVSRYLERPATPKKRR